MDPEMKHRQPVNGTCPPPSGEANHLVSDEESIVRPKIKFGLMKGRIWMADDFNDPLPDWLLDAFEGKSPD
jgi:hypothetical protein